MIVGLRNELGETKNVKVGFSWTLVLFGVLTPLYREDWKWFIISCVGAFLTFGLFNIGLAFKYNKIYIERLLREGYEPITEDGRKVLKSSGIMMLNE